MPDFKKNFIVIKKEILGLLDNPTSYISIIIFVFLWEFIFFRSVFIVGESSLRMLFDFLPWILMLFASSITMGVFSTEKSSGTIELLLTHPIGVLEVVIGKFFSSLLFITSSFIFAIPIAIIFRIYGGLDLGVVIVQLITFIFASASLVSLGIFLSALINNQIAAFLATSAASFFLVIAGSDFVTANLPLSMVPVFERLSIISHINSMSRGVIDVRDVWYFISFVIIFISLTYLQLLKDKYGNRLDLYRQFQIGVFLFIGIAVLTNIIGEKIPGRIDITSGKKYTLSGSTKKILKQMSDIVTITVYASGRLPSQLLPVVRDLKDTLRDYQVAGGSNIQVIYKDPSANPELSQEAANSGVKEVQFNVIGAEELQMKTGFLGYVISYGGQHETVPFIQDTNDLEYQLTSLIFKLTNKSKKTVAFLTGDGEKNISSELQTLKNELDKQYDVTEASINDTSPKIASNTAVLVVAGPATKAPQSTIGAIDSFIKSKGNVLFLIDSYAINPQTIQPTLSATGFDEMTASYGATLNKDFIYDLSSNMTIPVGQGAIGFYLPYPFWIKTIGVKESPVSNRIDGVFFPWVSSISLNQDKLKQNGYSGEDILVTSENAGVQTNPQELSPDKVVFDKTNLKVQSPAVALKPNDSKGKSGRLIIVGDSKFITDQFAQSSPQNIAFVMSSISWLSNDETLAGIKVKQNENRKLIFSNPTEPGLIKYSNLALVIILPSVLGFVRFWRRRNLKNIPYIRS